VRLDWLQPLWINIAVDDQWHVGLTVRAWRGPRLLGSVVQKIIVALLLAALSQAAQAQDAVAPLIVGAPPRGNVLRAGTPVALRTLNNLTTKGKHLKVGDRFSLEVAEPVLLRGQIVIPVGAYAVGEITSVRNKGMWGKSGNIETRLLYISTNERRIRISGSTNDKGVKAGGGAIATSAIVFLPAGFFMTGTSAVIPPGTVVNGIIEEDVPVNFTEAAPEAMTVPVTSPRPAAAAALGEAMPPDSPKSSAIPPK
jgi:hypothetical protein